MFGRSFWLGLSTQLSNPKTTIVYASVFAALLPADVPLWLFAVLPLFIFLLEAGWYAIVAVALPLQTTTTQMFQLVLYRFAAAGDVAPGFAADDLEHAFRERRRGLFRRRKGH